MCGCIDLHGIFRGDGKIFCLNPCCLRIYSSRGLCGGWVCRLKTVRAAEGERQGVPCLYYGASGWE